MKYPLTTVLHALATPDGFMSKTNKATLFHHLSDDYTTHNLPNMNDVYRVEDGNAVVLSLTAVSATFKYICLKLLDITIQGEQNVIFAIDQYLDGSIKSHERKQR